MPHTPDGDYRLPTSAERAEYARRALQEHNRWVAPERRFEDLLPEPHNEYMVKAAISDLLLSLRHYARAAGVDFERLDEDARKEFEQ